MTKKHLKHGHSLHMILCILFVGALVVPQIFRTFAIKLPFLRPVSQRQQELSPRELRKKLDRKDFVLINVHTPYEGEIEKTDTFVEFDSMKANQALLPQDKNTPIVLYCKTGRMSGEALGTLVTMGYTNVSHLKGGMDAWKATGLDLLDLSTLSAQVVPQEGFELPVSWGTMGPELIRLGVIDDAKFEKVLTLTDEQKNILTRGAETPITITSTNSQFVVDMLWAFGLAQQSIVYQDGPMGKEEKGNAGNFASTGGWSLAKGPAVGYMGKYALVGLTDDQQRRVGEIARHVFRPCCGNSTWFPDCNHGMAALGAIELMVAKDISDEEIYQNVLKLNSFWFQQHYLTVATYFARQGTTWEQIDAKMILGEEYSSAKGAADINKKVGPLPYQATDARGACGA